MKLEEMAKLKRTEQTFGLSQYDNKSFVLWGGGRSGNSSSGRTRIKYHITDVVMFNQYRKDGMSIDKAIDLSEIGIVELFIEDGTKKILGLINIEFKPKFRRQGYGSKLIQDIKDTTEAGFTVSDIQKKAQKFWEKVGIDYDSKRKEHGKINK